MSNDSKLPPHDLEAEQAVLGTILIDPSALPKIPFLTPEMFYREKNRWLFEACKKVQARSEAVNQITACHEMKRAGKLEAAGGALFLGHLVGNVVGLDVESYARVIQNCYLCRRLILISQHIANAAYDEKPAEKIIEGIYKELNELEIKPVVRLKGGIPL